MKENANLALRETPSIDAVVVVKRTGVYVEMLEGMM